MGRVALRKGQTYRFGQGFGDGGDAGEALGGVTAAGIEDAACAEGVRNLLVMERIADADEGRPGVGGRGSGAEGCDKGAGAVQLAAPVKVVRPDDGVEVSADPEPADRGVEVVLAEGGDDRLAAAEALGEVEGLAGGRRQLRVAGMAS